MANKLKTKGYDYTSEMLVIASDVDSICAYMTYIQLYIYNIPGVVKIENSLTKESRKVFYTPRLLDGRNIENLQQTEEKELGE
ncbi:hypothetical protein [uncultured Clostridium sp.]|uniref:hypothetical protein n=1 Tax=uncultured Clostridium sp. TaxID=59620 RepID=UPI00272BB595|nr:hypothetical protein [uncultured Clostridium sp.]